MLKKTNLEFRKIPSLLFLYEINENGTVLRNVKSKKHIQIKLDLHHSKIGYYASWICFRGKGRRLMVHKLVAECWLGPKPDGLEIDHIDRNPHNNHYSNLRYVTHSEQMKNRKLSERIIRQATRNCYEYTMKYVAKPVLVGEKQFPSMIQASKWLAEQVNKEPEHIRSKMKKRRSNIYGFDITYLNAETRHANPTG